MIHGNSAVHAGIRHEAGTRDETRKPYRHPRVADAGMDRGIRFQPGLVRGIRLRTHSIVLDTRDFRSPQRNPPGSRAWAENGAERWASWKAAGLRKKFIAKRTASGRTAPVASLNPVRRTGGNTNRKPVRRAGLQVCKIGCFRSLSAKSLTFINSPTRMTKSWIGHARWPSHRAAGIGCPRDRGGYGFYGVRQAIALFDRSRRHVGRVVA